MRVYLKLFLFEIGLLFLFLIPKKVLIFNPYKNVTLIKFETIAIKYKRKGFNVNTIILFVFILLKFKITDCNLHYPYWINK